MDEQPVDNVGSPGSGSGKLRSQIVGDVVVEFLPMSEISKGLCRSGYDPWAVRVRHNCSSISVISSEIFDPDQRKTALSRYKALVKYHTARWADSQKGRIPKVSKHKAQKTKN